MSQIFGEFTEELPPNQEYIVVGFSPGVAGVKHQWRNNGLSADFLADYRGERENSVYARPE